MSEKQDLAILYSLLEKPIIEFISSPAFKRLEQESEIIKHIEKFRLPEVNKLISCSDMLSVFEWADKYNIVRTLYKDLEHFDVLEYLMKYTNSPEEFEEKVLAVSGSDIISIIGNYFARVADKRDKEKKERSSLKGKITKAKKKAQDETDAEEAQAVNNDVKSEDELRVEALDRSIAEADGFLKIFKKHHELVKKYIAMFDAEGRMASVREKAYAAIDEIKPPREEEFLLEYIATGILTEDHVEDLKNYGFVQRLLECLDKNSYKDLAFPVLTKLYADGAIDFEDELVSQFVKNHSRLLAVYLEDRYAQDPEYLFDAENGLLIEYAIEGTVSGCNDFTTWWNTLTSPDDWKWILSKMVEIYGLPLEANATKLLHHVYGKSLSAFIDLLNSEEAQDISLSISEFIPEYVGQEAPESKDLVRGYIRNSEQANRKLQRRLAAKERELSRYSSELFSSIYLPLEQLENLAVNLRLSDGDIKCSLVAGQMIQAISALREGLTAMGLETADEIEKWERQSYIEYDAEKHRMSSPVINSDERVKLQTLGYSYVDDDGNKKVRAAEVYIPAPADEKKNTSGSQNKFGQKKENKHGDQKRQNDGGKKKNGYPRGGGSGNGQKNFTQGNSKKNKKNSGKGNKR